MKNYIRELLNPTSARGAKKQNRALILVWVLVAVLAIATVAQAITDDDWVTGWVICQPGDYVNARAWPTRKQESCGRLETGYELQLDGKTKNGFAHCEVGLEIGEGWVHTGYIVFDEPEWKEGAWYVIEAKGRVAARRYIGGPRRCWLQPGDRVQVFYWSDEWAVTTRGFIRSEYLREE
jgi:hypothetical protein